MKRALLIAGGTVGGLGAVLSVAPPQLAGSGINQIATASAATSNTSAPSTNPTSNSTKSTTKKSAASPKTASQSSTNAAGVTGTFTGDVIDVGYGPVQVKIVVSDGKITDATAIQAPSGRSQRFTDFAVPNLREQTLVAQSAAISGVSNASYTSYGWYKSLISALNKAGMPTGV